MSKFYTYSQNNSGGGFDEDSDVTQYVIIEANSSSEANNKALEIGIYFDGCDNNIDCGCCGDRWYEVDGDDGRDKPMIHSKSVFDYCDTFKWTNQLAIVHYLDGSKKVVPHKNNNHK